MLFGRASYSAQSLTGSLVTSPFVDFKKASDRLRDHFCGSSKYHKHAVETAQQFQAMMESRVVPINQQLSTIRAKEVSKNRKKLKSISEVVIFCGRQGIALRRHCDDWKHLDELSNSNPGNLMALLQFRAQSGDAVLLDYLNTASVHRNALYTSKTKQNEIISICGDIIHEIILGKVREAVFFSIMADEATDSANDEQLAVSVPYIDPSTRSIVLDIQ